MRKIWARIWLAFHRPVDRNIWEQYAESLGSDFAIPIGAISIALYYDKGGKEVVAYSAEDPDGKTLSLMLQYGMLMYGIDTAPHTTSMMGD